MPMGGTARPKALSPRRRLVQTLRRYPEPTRDAANLVAGLAP